MLLNQMPYEYVWYTVGSVGGTRNLVGVFIFRGDVSDPNPANTHIINVTQLYEKDFSFRGDLDTVGEYLVSGPPIINDGLDFFIRKRGLNSVSLLPFLIYPKVPRTTGKFDPFAARDQRLYWPEDTITHSILSSSERFSVAKQARDILFIPLDRRILVSDGGASANLIWDFNNSPITKDLNWSSYFDDGGWNAINTPTPSNLLISENQQYIFCTNPGASEIYIYERPGPYRNGPGGMYGDLPENNMIRLTTPVGAPAPQDGCLAHDPFNNEFHYSISGGNAASISIDTMTLVPSISDSNPSLVSSISTSTPSLSEIYFVDSDLCIATWKTNSANSTHLFKRISEEWIVQPYPFTQNPTTGTGGDTYRGVHQWPLDKRYILVTTISDGISYSNWYKRNGYTYDYVGPLNVGGYPAIHNGGSSAGNYNVEVRSSWINPRMVDAFYGTIVPPWSSTTKAIIDLQPVHHISPEEGEYSGSIFDIGTARIRSDGSSHTYTRNPSGYYKTNIGNPSLGTGVIATGEWGATEHINLYYRAHAFTESGDNIVQSNATFPSLAGQTSGTVVLLFKTSSNFSGYTNTSTNYINTIFKISSSTIRLLFGFNVASGVVKFAAGYYTTSTPGTTTTRKRVCDTTPMAVDSWYLVTVYQPGDGTDLVITINGVTQSYTTTGSASIDGWINNVIPLSTDLRSISIGNSTANERALTQFSISDAAILNRELTAGEISNTSNVVSTAAAADTRYPTIWKSVTFAQSPDDADQYGYGSTSRNGGGTAFGTLTTTSYKTGNTIHYFTNKREIDADVNFIYTFRLEIDGTVPQEDFFYVDYVYNTTTGDRHRLYPEDATYTAAAGGSNNVWVWTKKYPDVRSLTSGTTTLRFVF